MGKKLLLLIIGGIVIMTFFLLAHSLKAQNTPLTLVKINYITDDDFGKIFDLSTSVHYFYEKNGKDLSYMISQVNQSQLGKIISLGYITNIIDTNPVMDNYVIAYTPQSVPSSTFSVLGSINEIADHFTLVKINPQNMAQDPEALIGSTTAVFVESIAQPLPKPLYKTVRIENKYDSVVTQ